MKVLCFDIAKCTGWAAGETGKPPLCGSVYLSKQSIGDDRGPLYTTLRHVVRNLVSTHEPTHLGFEAAIAIGKRSAATQKLLFGLCAQVEQLADELVLPVFDMAVSTVRAYVVGDGRCGKPGVVAYCVVQGWPIDGPDAADACVLADYLLASLGAGRLGTGRATVEAIPDW